MPKSSPTRSDPQACPACRANPSLIAICTVCKGKGSVVIEKNGEVWEISPVGEPDHITYSHTAPADIDLTPRTRVSISTGWYDYERAILDPAGATNIQRKESRRVWYAAIQWFMAGMTAGLDADAEPTEADMAYMSGIDDELKQFVKDVKRGFA